MRRMAAILGVMAVTLGVAAPVAGAFPGLVDFQSPSHNIGCVMDRLQGAWEVRCDIRVRSWRPPAKPRSCHLDFGQGLQLGAGGRARYVCAGDTALGNGRALPYGHSISRGPIRCVSTTSAMTCTRGSHGFSLSRQRATLH